MTPEYQSKLNDAFRMVMERAAKKVETGICDNEVSAIIQMKSDCNFLHEGFQRGNMKAQRRDCELIAATAILYMVKFL